MTANTQKLLRDIRKNISTVSQDGGYWAARIDTVIGKCPSCINATVINSGTNCPDCGRV